MVLPVRSPSKRYVAEGVTPSTGDPPQKRYAALKAWLELANGETGSVLRLKVPGLFEALHALNEFHVDLDVPQFRAALERSVKASLESLVAWRARLHQDSGWAERYRNTGMKMGPSISLPSWDTGGFPDCADLQVDLDGFIQQNPVNIRGHFTQALIGADIDRFGKCDVCSKLYYGRRCDQKTCSPRCANALRVRRSRANQGRYEYKRKLVGRGAGRKRKTRVRTALGSEALAPSVTEPKAER